MLSCHNYMAFRILLWIIFHLCCGRLYAQDTPLGKGNVFTGPMEALSAGPKDSALHFFKLADAYMEVDRYDSAEYWLAKVGNFLPLNNPSVFSYYYYSRQAEVFYYNNLLQLGQQQATRAFQTAVALRDSLFLADSYNFLGLFSLNLEKFSEAEEFLLKGLQHYGNLPKALPPLSLSEAYHLHGNLGEVYTRLKKFDKALLHFDSSRLYAAKKNAYRAEALAFISTGEALLETGQYDSAKEKLSKGIGIALGHQDYDAVLFGYGVLAVLNARLGNAVQTNACLQSGNQLRKGIAGLNPYYALLYLRRAAEALDVLQDFKGEANLQKEIMKTEEMVRRKDNLMIEDVLSTGLRNENRLLQLEVEEAKQQQRDAKFRTIGLLLLIGLLILLGLYYRKSVRQKLLVAGIREKISQNLHDDIGASISSLHIYSTLAQETLSKQPEKTRELLVNITEQSRILMENLGDMVWSMHQHGSEIMGLGTRIKNFGAELLTAKDIQCRYEIEEEAFSLFKGYESRKNILLILKEAMNNMAKYSGATKAVVLFKKEPGHLVHLMVWDNGVGFETQSKAPGNGLNNIRARVGELNGQVTIDTAPGMGTHIHATIPIP